jgi:hypothetical protein
MQYVTEVSSRIVALQKGFAVHELQSNENTFSVLEAFFTD